MLSTCRITITYFWFFDHSSGHIAFAVNFLNVIINRKKFVPVEPSKECNIFIIMVDYKERFYQMKHQRNEARFGRKREE